MNPMKPLPTWSPKCGKYAGYMRHQDRGEQKCEACMEAMRQAETEYRRNNPDYVKRNTTRSKARQRARARLAKKYEREYFMYYYEELNILREAGEFPAPKKRKSPSPRKIREEEQGDERESA
jgi:hypothetical protein